MCQYEMQKRDPMVAGGMDHGYRDPEAGAVTVSFGTPLHPTVPILHIYYIHITSPVWKKIFRCNVLSFKKKVLQKFKKGN